jgi:pectin methylesterase-like acyl-CoA thioesterase
MFKTPKLLLILSLIVLFNINIKAQSVADTSIITWPFDLGTAGQVATYSAGTSSYYSTNWVENGANLKYSGSATNYSIKYTRFQPIAQSSSVDSTNVVSFKFRPTTGLSFAPKNISFDCMRYGTDGGSIDVVWKSSNGTKTNIATAIKPARDNSGAGTHASYDLSALTIPASNGDCGLYIYIYALGNTKTIGLSNINIKGFYSGTIIDIPKDTLTLAASPLNGGTVACFPVGTVFDEGTSLTVSATRAFGYMFSHWTSSGTDTISKNSSYTFIITKDTTLNAVFKPINTYSLTLNTSGGAQNYMVVVSPSGTVINQQTMYEEGTTVNLTAYGNQVLTFTNWLTGETNSTLNLQMTQNQNITAVYSAADYVVGWDFYKAGGNSRPADFYSTSENQTATLILRKADGTLNSWLDKSNISVAAAYNSARGSGINWKPLADQYYFQTSFVAKDFTDIKVSAGISYGYNAYTTQYCQYSLDGTNFTTVGTYTMPNTNTWYDNTFNLPADANHADRVYVRWIPDYNSAINGTTAVGNDGTSISNIFITATSSIFNDGVAPLLISSVPSNNSTGASATGKIVLTFDEKVMIASGSTGIATLNDKQLFPAISGKTVTFPYTGLEYNTPYTFTLPDSSVSDLTGNTLSTAITITFTTMTRPTVAKKLFDFVVGVDGDFKAALAAATAASSSGNRFRIFFPKGQYNIGPLTGDANQKTNISLSNISLTGEKDSSVVLYNKPTSEGISVTATLAFTSAANNIYMQDITLLNKLDYRAGSFSGRAAALQDQGNKNIFKNVHLLSNQDTYYSGGGRYYFEGGSLHGTVDFICGGGDVFFNESLLYLEDRTGNCITAPATASTWGYVFSNCTIDGFATANGNYILGRPWQNAPKSVYINTKMKILASAAGWGEMGVAPAVFAEYNSATNEGAPVDLSLRKTTWVVGGVTTTINPVLTTQQASQYTIENVVGGNDAWQPKLYTEQAPVPVISYDGSKISWSDNNYVLCWAICKNGSFIEFTTSTSYTVPSDVANGTIYTVRAANEMGGLGANSNEITISNSVSAKSLSEASVKIYPNPVTDMVNISVSKITKGSMLSVISMHGNVILSKPVISETSDLDLKELPAGIYLIRIVSGKENIVKQIVKK